MLKAFCFKIQTSWNIVHYWALTAVLLYVCPFQLLFYRHDNDFIFLATFKWIAGGWTNPLRLRFLGFSFVLDLDFY